MKEGQPQKLIETYVEVDQDHKCDHTPDKVASGHCHDIRERPSSNNNSYSIHGIAYCKRVCIKS